MFGPTTSKTRDSVWWKARLGLIVSLCLWRIGLSDASFSPTGPAPKITKPCNGQPRYSPDEKSCCEGRLFDIPETTHAQCCGNVAYWRNETKPDSCTVIGCGSERLHLKTEICCNGRPVFVGKNARKFCCGISIINTDKYDCCGQSPIKKNSDSGCCGIPDIETSTPVHHRSMNCDLTSRTVTLKDRHYFNTSDVCQGKLPEWDTIRPLPTITNASHHHIRGWPEKCMIKVNKQGTKILIPINPFFSGTELDSKCADSPTLHLVIKLKGRQKCPDSEERLQAYLHGVTLDIFFQSKIRCRNGIPTLRLKNNYNAVVYVSTHSNAILAQSVRFV